MRYQVFVFPKAKPSYFVNAETKDEALVKAAPKLLIAIARPDLEERQPREQTESEES